MPSSIQISTASVNIAKYHFRQLSHSLLGAVVHKKFPGRPKHEYLLILSHCDEEGG